MEPTQNSTQKRLNSDLFTKCYTFEDAKRAKMAGIYCFFRPIEETEGGTVTVQGKRRIMIGSNNYLGLTHHPKAMEAAQEAIRRFGTGFTGSRFLNGNCVLHEELEERLARFVGKESALCFATGFLSNQGALASLVGRKDVIYSDSENHASIIEGQRSALGDTLKFRHNDASDLERLLRETRDRYEGALIVADGVFSMSGDILDLPAIEKLAREYNCRLYVDDAHSLGVLGPKGQGTEWHFGMQGKADLVMGTFSKSFASVGGFVAGEQDVIDYIKHKARHFMFTAAMPPSAVATVLATLSIMENEPEHLEQLHNNARMMREGLNSMGYETLGSKTPIIPLLIGDDLTALQFTRRLYEEGIFATPVLKPAVPDGCALIRTSYMASHKKEDLQKVLEVLEKLGKEFGILGNTENSERLHRLAMKHFGRKTGLPPMEIRA